MKKLISADLTGINQILPHKNKWAWDLYLKGVANNWTPSEISMSRDVEQWRSRTFLSEDERLLVKRCLGFFAGAESLVANNLLLAIFRVINDGECRQYIGRQMSEELIHNHTVVYICDSLNLDISEVYEAYKTIPSIKAKDDFLMQITTDLGRPDFQIVDEPEDEAIECRKEILRNLIAYYIICEGVFFYAGFAMLLSFGRQNKLPGISEQIYYSLRDEANHLEFGTKLINLIIEQEPKVFTEDFKLEVIKQVKVATDLEIAYAHDVLPRGVLGLNADLFVSYMQYIANMRLEAIGLPRQFKTNKSPFPWMAEVVEMRKRKNFFETRVTEYQTGGGLVDDF